MWEILRFKMKNEVKYLYGYVLENIKLLHKYNNKEIQKNDF